MTVKSVGGGKYQVVHCHGKDAGKPISKPTTKAHAMEIHRAIEANKHGGKKK